MDNLENILKNDILSFEMVQDYIDYKNVNSCYKILSKSHLFDDDNKKILFLEIVNNSSDEEIINIVCREICTDIDYDYEYYKKIIEIISLKGYSGEWVSEIENELLNDKANTISFIFNDFSKEIPLHIDFDIRILQKLLESFDEKDIEYVYNFNRHDSIVICERLNDIITINSIGIIKMFYFINIKLNFNEFELDKFLNRFIYNYPYITKKFIESYNIIDNNVFNKYIIEKIETFDKQQKIKFDIQAFKPNQERIIKYQKKQIEQNREVNKRAREMSILTHLTKNSVILYGNRYGMSIIRDKKKEISTGVLKEFKYEYHYPLEYVLDPVDFMVSVSNLKNIGKE